MEAKFCPRLDALLHVLAGLLGPWTTLALSVSSRTVVSVFYVCSQPRCKLGLFQHALWSCNTLQLPVMLLTAALLSFYMCHTVLLDIFARAPSAWHLRHPISVIDVFIFSSSDFGHARVPSFWQSDISLHLRLPCTPYRQSNSYKVKKIGRYENKRFWIRELISWQMSVLWQASWYDLEYILCLRLSFFICNIREFRGDTSLWF